jgi:hypothetical protein
LEAKQTETEKGRSGETAKKEDRKQKAATKLGTAEWGLGPKEEESRRQKHKECFSILSPIS